MDWKECGLKRLIKKASIDEDLIESLFLSSRDKFETAKMIELSKVTASSKLSLYYESLREILEALALKYGYKIYNHDCFSAFLFEVLKEEDMAVKFDRFRKLRNKINYYGKRIEIQECEFFLSDLISLREKVLNKYFGGYL